MSIQYCGDHDYGIGQTLAAVYPLRFIGVPAPDQSIFSEASNYTQRADFHRVGDGFPSVQWIWDALDMASVYKLIAFLNGGWSRSLYIRTDYRVGLSPNADDAFHIYYAVMWKPILSGQEGTPIARSSRAFQTVKFTFMNPELQEGT